MSCVCLPFLPLLHSTYFFPLYISALVFPRRLGVVSTIRDLFNPEGDRSGRKTTETQKESAEERVGKDTRQKKIQGDIFNERLTIFNGYVLTDHDSGRRIIPTL